MSELTTTEIVWLAVGFAGQSCFFLRFLVQWMHSERQKRSVVPVSFWYLSLAGAAIVMAYAIYRKDPVFILGQTTGSIVYIRNLYLIKAERRAREKELLARQGVPGGAVAKTDPESQALG